MDPVIAILERIELSRSERSVLERYRMDPHGRTFLPLADVLRTHGLIDESIELLWRGMRAHPSFAMARVILARELFQKGLLTDAWQTLQDSPTTLGDNIVALKILFKLNVLFENLEGSERTRQEILQRGDPDEEIRELTGIFTLRGLRATKDFLLQSFMSSGVTPALSEERAIAAPPSKEVKATASDIASEAENFSVMPLNQVFTAIVDIPDGGKPLELDSATLAEIFEQQQHFAKAMEVYKRLLRLNPNSEFLKLRIRRVAKQLSAQKREDLDIDPSIVDQMEQIEVIDRQMQFLNGMLNRLG
jgi:tetratricopeptide (TPR) repeat protein